MSHRQRFALCGLYVTLAVVTGIALAGQATERSTDKDHSGDATLWHDVREFCVEGRGWAETKAPFDRLPAKAESVVRQPVWSLSRHAAGYCVRFVTDAPAIRARWSLTGEGLAMPHMPSTGVSGLDLYVKDDAGRWRWVAVGIPKKYPTTVAELIHDIPAGKREFLLFLPLYNGVTSVELGVPKGSNISAPDPPAKGRRKPIVFYGTSITQGGCATRPGMAYAAILRRWLDWPIINLGFSGNGKMEPELAELLAELDAAVYVIDSVGNMRIEEVEQRVEPLVRTLRRAHSTTPIVLVEGTRASSALPRPELRQLVTRRNAAQRAAYDRLVAAGVPNLHYMTSATLLGNDGEATVDGAHPTDLGFERMAEGFAAVLKPLLHEPSSAP
jgi:lysophospholipase L1-like esterase